MKEKIRKAVLYVLMLFTYPQRLADAVNRAATPEELDEMVIGHEH